MLWLIGGQVFDSSARRFRPAAVEIDGTRIAAVTATASPGAADRTIDVAGCYLLPGLIDCHVHLTLPSEEADPAAVATWPDALVALYAMKAAERTLLAGVTTARDCGGWNHVEMGVRTAIERGWGLGPRLFLAGKLLSMPTPGAAYYPGMYAIADGADAVRTAAREQLAAGADFIKVMATGAMLSPENERAEETQYSSEELRAAAEVAHEGAAHMAAHAHANQGILHAIEAGADSIEHGTFADDAALARMADRKVTLVPTFCPASSMLRDPAVSGAMAAHLRQRLVDSQATRQEMVRRARRLGVTIAMGTDAGTPGNHHGDNVDECIAMVEEGGLSSGESLIAATLHGARLLRRETSLGSLAPGKLADIIATREDPLDDIRALKRLALVLKDGGVVRSSSS